MWQWSDLPFRQVDFSASWNLKTNSLHVNNNSYCNNRTKSKLNHFLIILFFAIIITGNNYNNYKACMLPVISMLRFRAICVLNRLEKKLVTSWCFGGIAKQTSPLCRRLHDWQQMLRLWLLRTFMFTVSGLIMNGKRSSLQPFRLNYISFVHDNIAFI